VNIQFIFDIYHETKMKFGNGSWNRWTA